MIVGGEKPSLPELAHYGVMGMKWGHRQKATGAQVVAARKNLRKETRAYRQDYKKYKKAADGSARKSVLEAKLRKRQEDYLNNPDRVIATRMTAGEKFTTALLTSETGPGFALSLGVIAGTSVASRRIEYKQENGGYKVGKNAEVKSRIGRDQTARALANAGALVAPSLVQVLGKTSAATIGARAAANRHAAQTAYRAPKGIAAAAEKLKYAKQARGAFKITTL